jgi:hypothetical protein
MRRRAIFMVAEGQRPHPRRSYGRGAGACEKCWKCLAQRPGAGCGVRRCVIRHRSDHAKPFARKAKQKPEGEMEGTKTAATSEAV